MYLNLWLPVVVNRFTFLPLPIEYCIDPVLLFIRLSVCPNWKLWFIDISLLLCYGMMSYIGLKLDNDELYRVRDFQTCAQLLPVCQDFEFLLYPVNEILASINCNDFIFDLKLCNDELYRVSNSQTCETATPCLPNFEFFFNQGS